MSNPISNQETKCQIKMSILSDRNAQMSDISTKDVYFNVGRPHIYFKNCGEGRGQHGFPAANNSMRSYDKLGKGLTVWKEAF